MEKKGFANAIRYREYLAVHIGQEKANAFVNELTNKIENLKEHPEIYPPCRFERLQKNNFRCMRYKKYIVVYRMEGDEIRIYGVIYERRNPQIFEGLIK